MIHVVTPDLYDEYADVLDKMFQLRYRVFKERLDWEVQTRNGRERDAFDDLGPIYIINIADDGRVVATWRLLPTTGPYMLKDIFPALMDGEDCPVDPDIWECSRFAVDPGDYRDNAVSINRYTSELVIGILEYCQAARIKDVVAVYDIRIARMFPRIGAGPSWQKTPRPFGKTVAVAGNFPIQPYMSEGVRRNSGITGNIFARELPLPAVAA